MRKTMSILTVMLIIVLTITGCTTSWSYTFNLKTDEQIKIKLDTTNGQKLSQKDAIFTISDDKNEEISKGTFYLEEPFNQLYNTVDILDGVEIIEVGEKDNIKFIFYKVKVESTTEYNYLVKLENSKAGIVINNIISEESARGVFELLTFELNPNL